MNRKYRCRLNMSAIFIYEKSRQRMKEWVNEKVVQVLVLNGKFLNICYLLMLFTKFEYTI